MLRFIYIWRHYVTYKGLRHGLVGGYETDHLSLRSQQDSPWAIILSLQPLVG